MQAGAAVADLGASHHRWTVVEASSGSRTARALGDVFIHLAIFVFAGAETLDGSDDHAWVQFLDAFPGKAHTIEGAGCEILYQHIAILDQRFQHFLAFGILGIQRD